MINVRLNLEGRIYRIDYKTIEAVITDESLRQLLDDHNGICELWSSDLRVTAKPIESSADLREFLVANAKTFLHRFRK